MNATLSRCRGFTQPVVLLIRSSTRYTGGRIPVATGRCLSNRTTVARPHARLFTRGSLMLGQAKAKAPVKPYTPKVTSGPGATGSETQYGTSSYAYKLAQGKHGTILYEGAPHKLFIASSFAAGITCVSAAAINFYFNVYNLPAGVPEWTAYAFGALGLMLAILGTNFTLMPAGVVRSIKVLPIAAADAVKVKAHTPSPVQLEILVRRQSLIPGLPFKKIVAKPDEVVMKAKMYNPPPQPTEIEKMRMGKDWVERRKAQKEYDDNHRMTIPFRDAKWALSTILGSIRRGLTGDGFAPVEIKGKKYKLDISDAYALEDGRALDRLVKVDLDPRIAPLLKVLS